MPKIVSSAIVSSSDKNKSEEALKVYYCLCTQFAVILDTTLEQLPQRKEDGAYIVSTEGRVIRLNLEKASTKTCIARSPQLHETQTRLLCKRCQLPVGYVMADEGERPSQGGGAIEASPVIYIFPGGLVQDHDNARRTFENWVASLSEFQQDTETAVRLQGPSNVASSCRAAAEAHIE